MTSNEINVNALLAAIGKEDRQQMAHILFQDPPIIKLLSVIDYQFQDNCLLMLALTHSSFANETGGKLESNEKLEFLGDSILGVLVSRVLFDNYPEFKEGELSRFRGALVNAKALSQLARAIELGNCLLLGKGELQGQGRQKGAILSDALEALLGAIWLDGGYQETKRVFAKIIKYFKDKTGSDYFAAEHLRQFDAKSQLQEQTMKRYKVLPEYRAVAVGDKGFRVELYINGEAVASTISRSKKEGEQLLARQALSKFQQGDKRVD